MPSRRRHDDEPLTLELRETIKLAHDAHKAPLETALLPLHSQVMSCHVMSCIVMECNAMQCNAMQCNAMFAPDSVAPPLAGHVMSCDGMEWNVQCAWFCCCFP